MCQADAGPGVVPDAVRKGWVPVWRGLPALVGRDNLLAVELGADELYLAPTLRPGDIVLVDRDDWGQSGQNRFEPPGNIFLVREPGRASGGAVRRVVLNGQGCQNGQASLTFYGDNPACRPETMPLGQFGGDLRRAVLGRVVCSCSDFSER